MFALGDLEKIVDEKAVEMLLHQVDKDILSMCVVWCVLN